MSTSSSINSTIEFVRRLNEYKTELYSVDYPNINFGTHFTEKVLSFVTDFELLSKEDQQSVRSWFPHITEYTDVRKLAIEIDGYIYGAVKSKISKKTQQFLIAERLFDTLLVEIFGIVTKTKYPSCQKLEHDIKL